MSKEENNSLGITGETFKLSFKNNYTQENDLIWNGQTYFKVVTKPKRVWYKCLFEFLSFGLYKAPWEYIITSNV